MVPNRLKEMVEAGHLGVKSGRGFYKYKNGKPIKTNSGAPAPGDTADRLILRMANEAVAVMSEHIVESEDLLDAGMVFGTGFAPFRGGIMEYLKTRGYEEVHTQLGTLAHCCGDRFKPVQGWKKYD